VGEGKEENIVSRAREIEGAMSAEAGVPSTYQILAWRMGNYYSLR